MKPIDYSQGKQLFNFNDDCQLVEFYSVNNKVAIILDAGRPAIGFSKSTLTPKLVEEESRNLHIQEIINNLIYQGFRVVVVQGTFSQPISGADVLVVTRSGEGGPIKSLSLAISQFKKLKLFGDKKISELLVIYSDSPLRAENLRLLLAEDLGDADAKFLTSSSVVSESNLGNGLFLEVNETVGANIGGSNNLLEPTNGPFWFSGQLASFLSESGSEALLRHDHLGPLLSDLKKLGWRVTGVGPEKKNLSKDRFLVASGKFAFGTKAETLAEISEVHRPELIPEFTFFNRRSWTRGPDEILANVIQRHKKSRVVAIRSSFIDEDMEGNSNAGKFHSALDVETNDGLKLSRTINEVLASSTDPSPLDQVMIQNQVEGSLAAGVITTKSNQGAPYISISLSRKVGDTVSITSGDNSSPEEFVFWSRGPIHTLSESPEFIQELVVLAQETQTLLAQESLDIEFAIDAKKKPKLLQVRIFNTQKISSEIFTLQAQSVIAESISFSRNDSCSCPDETHDLYALMPDWNPVEIIGYKPKSLARSLYGYVVTNDTWCSQRTEYGYYQVDHPLLRDFLGTPAVDISSSFLSFVPKSLPRSLADRIVRSAKQRLRDNPDLHDKVEFEVMPTCFDSDFGRWRNSTLRPELFDEAEYLQIRESYLRLTNFAIQRRLRNLNDIPKKENDDSSFFGEPENDAILQNLELARIGALEFSHFARDAFVAACLLYGFENLHGDKAAVEDFVSTLETISSQFVRDCVSASEEKIGVDVLIEKYGHLRAGTYEILSPAFKSDPDFFFGTSGESAGVAEKPKSLDAKSLTAMIAGDLRDSGFDISNEQLHLYLTSAIAGREAKKLAFTKYLSTAIDLIAEWGLNNHITKDQLSHLTIETLKPNLRFKTITKKARDGLLAQSSKNSDKFHMQSLLEVPSIISRGEDLIRFSEFASSPNFFGNETISAPVIILDKKDQEGVNRIKGNLVLIESADPGYDWIFSKKPAGLITLFGGKNSHMAIRCMEFNLPAAIGVGRSKFEKLQSQEIAHLDPKSRSVV